MAASSTWSSASEGKDPVEFIFIDILCLIKYLLETQESV